MTALSSCEPGERQSRRPPARDCHRHSSAVLADGWIAGIAVHLPWVGRQLQAARALRTAGEDAASAGASLVGLAAQLADPGTAQQPLIQRMVRIATQSAPVLASAQARLVVLVLELLPNGVGAKGGKRELNEAISTVIQGIPRVE
jgi:hypothetical protein